MIFLTVGSELPFSRLVKAVDEWAALHPDLQVTAQVGKLAPADHDPLHLRTLETIAPEAYETLMDEASVIVAHAGMGSIIGTLKRGKAIVMLARTLANGETRNDHQIATARKFSDRPNVFVADTAEEVGAQIDKALAWAAAADGAVKASPYASDELLDRIRTFINS